MMRRGHAFNSRILLAETWTRPQALSRLSEKLPERFVESIVRTLKSWSRHPFLAVLFAPSHSRSKSPKFLHLDDAYMLAHLDGELSTRARQQVADHLQSCWSCRGRFRELRASIDVYIQSRESQSPDLLSDTELRIHELRQRIAQESEISTPSR
jgi:Putative zinc-finger